jgi:hypothetical protein
VLLIALLAQAVTARWRGGRSLRAVVLLSDVNQPALAGNATGHGAPADFVVGRGTEARYRR